MYEPYEKLVIEKIQGDWYSMDIVKVHCSADVQTVIDMVGNKKCPSSHVKKMVNETVNNGNPFAILWGSVIEAEEKATEYPHIKMGIFPVENELNGYKWDCYDWEEYDRLYTYEEEDW